MAKYKIIPSSRTIVQSPISIGHKAEKGVEAIEFDLTAWVETYGSGTLTVIMRRWGDAIPYPIALEIDENNKATWTLSDIDTAKAGMAYAQLNYIVGDEVVKKSDIYTFRVMDSLTGEGEPPEAYDSWLEHLTHLAAEAMAEVLDIEGIVTDKTLTVNGGIADAKAAGDALALKADKSTTYTKTEVDQMIEDVEVETDTTLEVAGAAADAAETGRQIGLLKADLGAVGVFGKIAGYYINLTADPVDINNPSVSSTGLTYSIIDCSEGDKFVINAVGATNGRAWGFLDNSNHVLSMADQNATVTDLELTAPTNAVKLIINDKSGGMSYKVGNNLASKVYNQKGLSPEIANILLSYLYHTYADDEFGEQYFNRLKRMLNTVKYHWKSTDSDAVIMKGLLNIFTENGFHQTKYTENATRAVFCAAHGEMPALNSDGVTLSNYYPILIPEDAKTITITKTDPSFGFSVISKRYTGKETEMQFIHDTGWKNDNVLTYPVQVHKTKGRANIMWLNIRKNDNSEFSVSAVPVIDILFE